MANEMNIQQKILSPTVLVNEVPMEPFVASFTTNNFIQNTLSRLCAFDDNIKRWRPLRVDELGRIELSVNIDNAAAMRIADRESKTVKVINAVVVPSLGVITHSGVNFDGYNRKAAMVSTTDNCTIYPQVSTDGVSWYDVKTTADADWTFNCNNEGIEFEMIDACKLFRLVIKNNGSGDTTITAELYGVM